MGGGGVGFTLGTRQTETTADIAETTHIGSLIGSLEGRVDIAAGGDVTITGSEVISQDGIGISGQNVTIQAAENTTAITETQRSAATAGWTTAPPRPAAAASPAQATW